MIKVVFPKTCHLNPIVKGLCFWEPKISLLKTTKTVLYIFDSIIPWPWIWGYILCNVVKSTDFGLVSLYFKYAMSSTVTFI